MSIDLAEHTLTVAQVEHPGLSWPEQLNRFRDHLNRSFGVDFNIWNADTSELVYESESQPQLLNSLVAPLVAEVGRQATPQFLADEDAIVVLGIPVRLPGGENLVAGGAFVTSHLEPDARARDGAARLIGRSPEDTAAWINRQPLWPAHALNRVAGAFHAGWNAEQNVDALQRDVENVSSKISSTYEEISLLYNVAQNLRISNSDEKLGVMAIDWLLECVPAQCIAVQYLPVADVGGVTYKARTKRLLLHVGDCPVDDEQFCELVDSLQIKPGDAPLVLNGRVTGRDDWRFRGVRQMIAVPLPDRENAFGWLTAFNHLDDGEFGTEEANLLNSVAAMMGIHCSNHELYRQQAEFVANVVAAFTSAIDAKDPYTCGHSDRVARIAVRLGKELGCDRETLHTIYMAGLLHDIGKIGISDAVLGKPGRLTDAEFEHIKLHPELGYKILADLKQLSDVLPAVLHHHEQFDGRGYPHGLSGDDIPWIARIMAVADSYDAMTSDRPYRQGMPHEKVDQIFRAGAGNQWDQRVVDAYFSAREDIRNICDNERAQLTLDIEQWT